MTLTTVVGCFPLGLFVSMLKDTYLRATNSEIYLNEDAVPLCWMVSCSVVCLCVEVVCHLARCNLMWQSEECRMPRMVWCSLCFACGELRGELLKYCVIIC